MPQLRYPSTRTYIADIPLLRHLRHCSSQICSSGGFPVSRRRSEPVIWDSYSDVSPDAACPNCAAAAGLWCSTPDGRVRRIPCVSRPRSCPRSPASDEPEATITPTGGPPELTLGSDRSQTISSPEQLDFTEPRHRRDDD